MKNSYILLRHGETKYQANNLDILYSKEDQIMLPITQKGEKKIKEVAKQLKEKEIDIIYASDFYRTRQTAEIVAKEIKVKVILDKRLRDTDFGFFSGRPAQEYRMLFKNKLQRFSKRPEGGESCRDVKRRISEFFKQTERKYRSKTILVISHADPIWLFSAFLKKLTEKETLKSSFYPDTGEYIEFSCK
ncbi:MAG: hypothetical protein A2365_02235 [Candidatus Nealsonbacteria bacterium RIFOXYB1_FULL_40_15]|uniref:Phosphoglycerate mutase n=2 Tax=Candidatus Nealsoniibacteriota TaxID=1817911 RepID=A0A1G2ETB8_9BACT|nr:MAG: hypothetical protein A2365_02235 [Candidatus Nealsonbacteria bacterium RIFOXYB1_FULL_40_15]OGZ28474.1 MAG: hypothetical protein A2562_03320 [Candidatus Nealsonbacteria bacterium RIFOXYD1_FULL_39_11]OGZ29085.1 MAG: hypothetical protein A2427_02085 [Candidatus Nealsonbacteria bacterium RIFOXYC1_FULL_40_7]